MMSQLLLLYSIQLVKEKIENLGLRSEENASMREFKLERKVDCWNGGGNQFVRVCSHPAKKDGDKKDV